MKLGCRYCMPNGRPDPEPGWIEMDNNGPIVSCPICNKDGDNDRIWELAYDRSGG